MKRLAAIVLAAAVATAAPAAMADIRGNAETQQLVSEGLVLASKGQLKDASEKFEKARLASPEASSPLSAFAFMLFHIAKGDKSPAAQKQLELAEMWARKALELAADDPLANEVLRGLENQATAPVIQPPAAVAALYYEAETLFQHGKYEEARVKYREVQRGAPQFAPAFVMEGDTYYMQRNWAAAEVLFLKGAEMTPANSQAWRFLADTRAQIGDKPGVLLALANAIAARPGDQGSWERLNKVMSSEGKALTHLRLERKAKAMRDPETGKYTIQLASEFKDASETPDRATWLAYALAQAATLSDGKPETDFARELRSWNVALEVSGKDPLSPDLLRLRDLRQAGQLDAAILLLMYKDAYAPELEAWKAANPDGITKFIERYKLMP